MVETRDLSFTYARAESPALGGLDFRCGPGELVLVSGPTGCGKSTLALALSGAAPQVFAGRRRGEVAVFGADPAAQPLGLTARRLGLVMQDVEHQIFTDTVMDEVAFGLENLAMPEEVMPEAISRALGEAGIAHLGGRKIDTLSAGERQRAVMAAVFAMGADALVLDEPLAFVDEAAAGALLSKLRGVADAGKAVIVIEHRRDAVRPFADREVFMLNGRAALGTEPRSCFEIALPGAAGATALEFDGVSFGWERGGGRLLRDVSFRVRSGESVVMVGGNGSGKSTMLRLAMGLGRVDGGAIVNCGQSVSAGTRRLARRAALVHQNPDRQLRLPTVLEEVARGAASAEEAAQEIARLGLSGLESRHPHSLSMGQRRRLTIAAALARKPSLLLLDEPTVGQDDESLSSLLRRLGEFAAEGGALLMATHDRRAAACMASRTLTVHNGTVTESADRRVAPLTEAHP